MTENPAVRQKGGTLESWKEIAAYLYRDVSTVRRWEKEEGLPVRRHEHRKGSSVYAIPAELDAWRAGRQPEPEAAPKPLVSRRLAIAAAVTVTLLGSGWAIWRAGLVRVPYPLVEAAESGAVARRVWSGSEDNVVYFASTDGRRVAFTDWKTGDLAVLDLDSGARRLLTDKGSWAQSSEYAQNPVLSPDGRQVAHGWFNGRFYELRIVGVDGSNARVVLSNAEVAYIEPHAWSPDGSWILAAVARKDRTNQIVVISTRDGTMRVLKSLDWRWPEKLSFSRDGRYVAYDLQPDQQTSERDIFVLEIPSGAGTGREHQLVRHPAQDSWPFWTRDGTHVVFFSDRTSGLGLWAIPVSEGRAQGPAELVKAETGRISPLGFSREGVLYYGLFTGLNGLYTAEVDLATGRLRSEPAPLTHRYGQAFGRPEISTDGRYLAYRVGLDAPTPGEGRPRRIVLREIETGKERELNVALTRIRGATRWRPDGRSLLVWGDDEKNRPGVFLVGVENASLTPLVTQPGEPDASFCAQPEWSADGAAIFCQRYAPPDGDSKEHSIVRREVATGQETVLYRSKIEPACGNLNFPSPDGKWIAFRPSCSSPALNLLSTEGGEPREIYRAPGKDEFVIPLSWTPDSRHVIARIKDQVWRIPVDGGAPQKWEQSWTGLAFLRVHPDGKRIVYRMHQPGAEIWALENFLPKTVAAR